MPPDFLPTHHRSLRLQNFTAFGDATFEFVPGVNVLVGENGTGKTHALKALYGYSRLTSVDRNSNRLVSYFSTDRSASVLRFGSENATVSKPQVPFSIEVTGHPAPSDTAWVEGHRPIFLPAVDMIGHTKGYLALDREYDLDFDRTHADIVALLELTTKHQSGQLATEEMQTIQDRMGGTVEYDAGDRRFYLATPQGRIAMPLVAEGLRKFATLHTIWKNGWLRPGTCLFWDEPEANLNPSLMDEAVAAILALARGGVQVFLATHSYVILKELEVQMTAEDSVRFFALEKTDDGTIVRPADRYLDLKPNLIEDQYASLFERALEKRLREQVERV